MQVKNGSIPLFALRSNIAEELFTDIITGDTSLGQYIFWIIKADNDRKQIHDMV